MLMLADIAVAAEGMLFLCRVVCFGTVICTSYQNAASVAILQTSAIVSALVVRNFFLKSLKYKSGQSFLCLTGRKFKLNCSPT